MPRNNWAYGMPVLDGLTFQASDDRRHDDGQGSRPEPVTVNDQLLELIETAINVRDAARDGRAIVDQAFQGPAKEEQPLHGDTKPAPPQGINARLCGLAAVIEDAEREVLALRDLLGARL